ncbi:MAG TPA: arsenate reductase ArsC [Gammaproteobacteria bacterium]|nr:arsenate reductase ArsC [Gammaproteobacteria bacterium]
MRIVFVDQDNTCRSQLAEALVSLDAAEGVEAYSAGFEAGDELDANTRQVMEELGYDMSAHFTKSLDDLPDLEFDYVVSLGVGDPMLKARMSLEWDVPDPRIRDVRSMRDMRDTLRERITRLLAAPRTIMY